MKHTINNAKQEVVDWSKGFFAWLRNLWKVPARLWKSLVNVPLDFLKVGYKWGMWFVDSVKKDIADTLTTKPSDSWFKKTQRKIYWWAKALVWVPIAYVLYKPISYIIHTPKWLWVATSNFMKNTAWSISSIFKPKDGFTFVNEERNDVAIQKNLTQDDVHTDNQKLVEDESLRKEQVVSQDVTATLAAWTVGWKKKTALELATEKLDTIEKETPVIAMDTKKVVEQPVVQENKVLENNNEEKILSWEVSQKWENKVVSLPQDTDAKQIVLDENQQVIDEKQKFLDAKDAELVSTKKQKLAKAA